MEKDKEYDVKQDVKIAVLEERVQTIQKNVEEGFKEVNSTLKELKERNSVSEFFRENWKAVAVVIAMVVGGDAWKVAEILLKQGAGV